MLVYKEHIFDEDYNIYLVNSPTFTPTTATIKANFNAILNQTVASMGENINIINITSTDWDVNGNGKFDHFAGYGFLADETIGGGTERATQETGSLILELPESEECIVDMNNATIIVNYPIRYNWVISNNYDHTNTSTNTTLSLVNTDVYNVVKINDPEQDTDGHYEQIYVDAVNGYDITFHNVKPEKTALEKSYLASEAISIVSDIQLAAFTPPLEDYQYETLSCSFHTDNPSYKVVLHEYFHQQLTGFIRHVEDPSNLMTNGSITNTKLRYRKLSIPFTENGIDQNQWTQIHEL